MRSVRLSVQRLSVTAIVLLMLSTSLAISGLVWSSVLLQRTSASLVRAANDLRLARDLEQSLFAHQRLSIVADATSDETRRNEQAIIETIRAAQRNARDEVQAELLDTLATRAAAYFEQHASAMERASSVETFVVARPLFDRAIETVLALGQNSEAELQRGNASAQRLGRLFRLTAIVAAILALALVMLIALAVRRVILTPILEIREALVRFRKGDYGVQANEDIAPELAEIAGAFNDMKGELARQREERLAFLGGVAHDLRNPLAGLKAGVETLELDLEDPAIAGQTLRLLRRQLESLERMCTDLLELSRVEAGKLTLNIEAFDLRDAAVAVTDLYRPVAKSRELVLQLDREPVIVTADRLRIEQVIGNLVKNAIKYSGEHGRITIDVSRRGDEGEISVSDNGAGIAEDELQSIFQPFRQGSVTPSTGAGLGLFVVERIVALHKGSIDVVSQLGTGSTFSVRLPSPR